MKRSLYSLSQSPLYKLQSKQRLYKLLDCTKTEVNTFMGDTLYSEFKEGTRSIQAPTRPLKKLQKRLNRILSRVELPNYLHSGRKEHSTLNNANTHINAKQLISLDIRKFFPSTPASRVYRMFNEKFECSEDVAYILTQLCTYKKAVPTGSPISMTIAFWANRDMFDELDALAMSENLKFSTYVDDIAFSGEVIKAGFQKRAKDIIRKHGMVPHPDKVAYFSDGRPILLTGIVIDNGKLSVRRKHMQSIHEEGELLKNATFRKRKIHHLEKLAGRLHSAGQIEDHLKQKAKFATEKLQELIKQDKKKKSV